MNNLEVNRFLNKTIEVIFGKSTCTGIRGDSDKDFEDYLSAFSSEWFEYSSALPSKGKNNTQYMDRITSWVVSNGGLKALLLSPRYLEAFGDFGDFSGRGHSITPKCVNIKRVRRSDRDPRHKVTALIVTKYGKESVQDIDIRLIVPLFGSYAFGGNGSLSSFEQRIQELEQPHTVRNSDNRDNRDDKYDSNSFSINLDTVIKQSTLVGSRQMNKTNKFQSTVDNVATTGKNSFNTASGIVAGNATNAVVKAALRPALEPALRKLLEPKGLIQRTLGKGKVEDSVSTILDSPLMDVLAATLLITITSSGLVQNEKLVKGAALASDAAMIKLANLVDFDVLLSGVVDKVTSIVSTLDHVETK